MSAKENLIRLPGEAPYTDLAAEWPDAFSLSEGRPLQLIRWKNAGYSLEKKGGRVTISYAKEADLMRALGRWLTHPGFDSREEPVFSFRGLMIDCSRNAVPKPEFLKDTLVRLGLLGFNALCLYTEDTYEVRKHPEMGYLRGRYTECELRVGLTCYKLATDGEGRIEKRIPISATSGKLTIQGMVFPFQIGYLDPIDEVTGCQARLNNLGYYAGPLGQADDKRIRLAVEEFQCDHGLKVDGVCGPNTLSKLKEVHGC